MAKQPDTEKATLWGRVKKFVGKYTPRYLRDTSFRPYRNYGIARQLLPSLNDKEIAKQTGVPIEEVRQMRYQRK